ncbi:DUF6316 family protein [Thiohalophilus sp.]|uniref:DUF6316 family protein n=1 Tax=Thiohalophilus sp. TaxID=3028392 RepID=UPI002ACD47E7|nr:DUF6316 family protein [Thiohalophilus sp.]MDZ7805334.1 DUF6316 family protein [Thiohalophilus sp.]
MHQFLNRHGEMDAVQPRSERFYNIADEWWFAIRRGPDQGPYPTQSAARQALIEYINDQLAFEKQLQEGREQLKYLHY